MSSTRDSVIEECGLIRQVFQYCTFDTTFLVDIDNTVTRPTHEEDVGSDQWFREVLAHAFEQIPERPHAMKSILTLNSAIQSVIKIKAVEPDTCSTLSKFQDLNMTTIAVTARGVEVIDATLLQLSQINVRFAKQDTEALTFVLEGRVVTFVNNILFCNGLDKGLCLAALNEMQSVISRHVVMLDDVAKNLENVKREMTKLGVQFVGLRYNHLDQRVTRFELERANVKLLTLKSIFSRSVANIIDSLKLSTEDKSSKQIKN